MLVNFIEKSHYAKLAREALEHFLRTGKAMDLPSDFPDASMKAAVYVSIKKNGENRGCMGSFAVKPNVGLEIIHNSIRAGVEDVRFFPVKIEELEGLTFSVDVFSQPEAVRDENDLNPSEFGVIVHSGKKHALLLPSLDGIDSVDKQLKQVKIKAKISNREPVELFKFTSTRYME
jgi:AmmeMemoRadiSam system protein A